MKAATARPFYSCDGVPYDGSANNVCHGLAITRNSYFSGVPTTFKGAGAQLQIESMYCFGQTNCNGWISNQVKVADDNGNWVEAGLIFGDVPGYSTQPTSLYWSDSRPQDVNSANYHVLAAVTSAMYGHNLQIDIARSRNNSDNSWFVSMYAPGVTYNGSALDSTPNTYVPTNVQMGEFLIGSDSLVGAYPLGAQAELFTNRYYLNTS